MRQGLKEYSSWPTYPQVGGSRSSSLPADAARGCARPVPACTLTCVRACVRHVNACARVCTAPACEAIGGLWGHQGCTAAAERCRHPCGPVTHRFTCLSPAPPSLVPFRMLWQVFVKGELLGGCDIVLEMAEAGELKDTIEEMKARM